VQELENLLKLTSHTTMGEGLLSMRDRGGLGCLLAPDALKPVDVLDCESFESLFGIMISPISAGLNIKQKLRRAIAFSSLVSV